MSGHSIAMCNCAICTAARGYPIPMPPLPAEETLFMEPLVGWRLWGLNAFDLRIFSGAPNVIWAPKTPLRAVHQVRSWAVAPQPCEDAPCENHIPRMMPGCGIYAFKEERYLREIVDAYSSSTFGNIIIGTVYLWGRIFEHERGYRAQYAYPKSFVYTNAEASLTALAALYNVPVEEDLSWKSASPSVVSLPSPSSYQSPYASPLPPPSLLRQPQTVRAVLQALNLNPSKYLSGSSAWGKP